MHTEIIRKFVSVASAIATRLDRIDSPTLAEELCEVLAEGRAYVEGGAAGKHQIRQSLGGATLWRWRQSHSSRRVKSERVDVSLIGWRRGREIVNGSICLLLTREGPRRQQRELKLTAKQAVELRDLLDRVLGTDPHTVEMHGRDDGGVDSILSPVETP